MKFTIRFFLFFIFFTLLGSYFYVSPAFAAITSQNPVSQTVSNPPAPTYSFSYTPGAGTNQLLIVGVSLNPEGGEFVSSVSYGGMQMNALDASTYSEGGEDLAYAQLFWLKAPNPGPALPIDVVFSSTITGSAVIGAITFNGVDQNFPVRQISGVGANGHSPTASILAPADRDDYVFDVVSCHDCTALFAGPGAPSNFAQWNTSIVFGGETEFGGGSTDSAVSNDFLVTMAWNFDNNTTPVSHPWAQSSVAIRPALTSSIYMNHRSLVGSSVDRVALPGVVPDGPVHVKRGDMFIIAAEIALHSSVSIGTGIDPTSWDYKRLLPTTGTLTALDNTTTHELFMIDPPGNPGFVDNTAVLGAERMVGSSSSACTFDKGFLEFEIGDSLVLTDGIDFGNCSETQAALKVNDTPGVVEPGDEYVIIVDQAKNGAGSRTMGLLSHIIIDPNPPILNSVMHSPDPIEQGAFVTFTTNWTELEGSNNVKTFICRTSGIDPVTGCTGGELDSSSYTAPDGGGAGQHIISNYQITGNDGVQLSYWAYVCDDHSQAPSCSSSQAGVIQIDQDLTRIDVNDPNRWAWNDIIGWIDFCDEEPGTGICRVDTDSPALSEVTGGNASSSVGAIYLNCNDPDLVNGCAPPYSDWKITRDGSGVLSGWAWNEIIGWISFNCENDIDPNTPGVQDYCATSNHSVFIVEDTFFGWAWNDVVGWISFNCDNLPVCPIPYKVKTVGTPPPTVATLESSTFELSSEGASINSVMWRGHESTDGGTVSIYIATSNCDNGADDPPLCTTGVGWTEEWLDDSMAPYVAGQNTPIPVNRSLHADKKFARYRVMLDLPGASVDTPIVRDVIINFSP
ncbi:MAG: hypothetical protein COU08_01275 [Candidatus Harrisonbacteria bacterium CG10_big_fil_rev_8_21_14_0_10_42_17]|uniref:Uncharacterized protein n=1 Tax=Candidatus Harrisonbacteria bacterium CG10_big_fil_rev_8_21_14_0_10_42_17 TaxID=1974584 RepID=A0A2M6WII7_9BACT|nr:MAG: hypothetical protein COU08_01275 [Candidatus Harrisonbacteria bacterium CG10_big_fil_rev_8_21_14_0_10_42_17]